MAAPSSPVVRSFTHLMAGCARFRRTFLRPRKVFCAALAFVYFHSNVLTVYSAEADFWAQRRSAAQRMKDKPTLAESLPGLGLAADETPKAGLSAEQYQLLAQLPKATNFDFNSAENVSITSGLENLAGARESARVPPGARGDSPTWLSTLVLPYGSIRDVYLSRKTDAPLVIHIQDAHDIAEAQQNMAAIIRGLREERGVNLVGLEGAQGAFALEPYREYADPAVLKGLADHLLDGRYIGGAEYVGLTAAEPPLLWGVEDLALYESNIQSFKDSLKHKPAVHAALGEIGARLDALKARAYSAELKEFDRHFGAYKGRRESLGQYVRYLMSVPGGDGLGYTNLHLLLDALHWEESLDFKLVEKERLELVELLARELSDDQLSQVVQQSLLYRLGRMSYGDYHRFLKGVCRRNGLSLDNFPQLSSYITYVLLAEQINRNQLLLELSRLEEAAQNALAATPAQKRLVALNRDLLLLGKITGHSMTQADWIYYYGHKDEILQVAPRTEALAREFGEAAPLRVPADFTERVKPFEDFCRYAMQRNHSLIDNLLAKLGTGASKSAILVAGGFHSDGLTQLMRQKDVSYVVITPKITDVPKEDHYLDVFARDPLPLEQLFTGEVINLAARRVMAANADLSEAREGFARSLLTAVPLAGLELGDGADAEAAAAAQAEKASGLPGVTGRVSVLARIFREGLYRTYRIRLPFSNRRLEIDLFVAKADAGTDEGVPETLARQDGNLKAGALKIRLAVDDGRGRPRPFVVAFRRVVSPFASLGAAAFAFAGKVPVSLLAAAVLMVTLLSAPVGTVKEAAGRVLVAGTEIGARPAEKAEESLDAAGVTVAASPAGLPEGAAAGAAALPQPGLQADGRMFRDARYFFFERDGRRVLAVTGEFVRVTPSRPTPPVVTPFVKVILGEGEGAVVLEYANRLLNVGLNRAGETVLHFERGPALALDAAGNVKARVGLVRYELAAGELERRREAIRGMTDLSDLSGEEREKLKFLLGGSNRPEDLAVLNEALAHILELGRDWLGRTRKIIVTDNVDHGAMALPGGYVVLQRRHLSTSDIGPVAQAFISIAHEAGGHNLNDGKNLDPDHDEAISLRRTEQALEEADRLGLLPGLSAEQKAKQLFFQAAAGDLMGVEGGLTTKRAQTPEQTNRLFAPIQASWDFLSGRLDAGPLRMLSVEREAAGYLIRFTTGSRDGELRIVYDASRIEYEGETFLLEVRRAALDPVSFDAEDGVSLPGSVSDAPVTANILWSLGGFWRSGFYTKWIAPLLETIPFFTLPFALLGLSPAALWAVPTLSLGLLSFYGAAFLAAVPVWGLFVAAHTSVRWMSGEGSFRDLLMDDVRQRGPPAAGLFVLFVLALPLGLLSASALAALAHARFNVSALRRGRAPLSLVAAPAVSMDEAVERLNAGPATTFAEEKRFLAIFRSADGLPGRPAEAVAGLAAAYARALLQPVIDVNGERKKSALAALAALLAQPGAALAVAGEAESWSDRDFWSRIAGPLASAVSSDDREIRGLANRVWADLAPALLPRLKRGVLRAREVAEEELGAADLGLSNRRNLNALLQRWGVEPASIGEIFREVDKAGAGGRGVLLDRLADLVRRQSGAALARAGLALIEDSDESENLAAWLGSKDAALSAAAFDIALQMSAAHTADTIFTPARMSGGTPAALEKWIDMGAVVPLGGALSARRAAFARAFAARMGLGDAEGLVLVPLRDPRYKLAENELHRRSFYTQFFQRAGAALVGKGIGTPIQYWGRTLIFSRNKAKNRDEGAMVSHEVTEQFETGGSGLLRAAALALAGEPNLQAAARHGFDPSEAFMTLALEVAPDVVVPVGGPASVVEGTKALGGRVHFVAPVQALTWGEFPAPEYMAGDLRVAFYEVPVPTRYSELARTVAQDPASWAPYFARMGYRLPAVPDLTAADYREAAGKLLRKAAANFGVWAYLYGPGKLDRIGGFPTLDGTVSDFRPINMNPFTVFDHGSFKDLGEFRSWAMGDFVMGKLRDRYRGRSDASLQDPAFIERVFRENQLMEYWMLHDYLAEMAARMGLPKEEAAAAEAIFKEIAGEAPDVPGAPRARAYVGEEVLAASVVNPVFAFLLAGDAAFDRLLSALAEVLDGAGMDAAVFLVDLQDVRSRDAAERAAAAEEMGLGAALLNLLAPEKGLAGVWTAVLSAAGFAAASADDAGEWTDSLMGAIDALKDPAGPFALPIDYADVRVLRAGADIAGLQARDLFAFGRDSSGRVLVYVSDEALRAMRREAAGDEAAFRAAVMRGLLHEHLEARGLSHERVVELGFGRPEAYPAGAEGPLTDVSRMAEAFSAAAGSAAAVPAEPISEEHAAIIAEIDPTLSPRRKLSGDINMTGEVYEVLKEGVRYALKFAGGLIGLQGVTVTLANFQHEVKMARRMTRGALKPFAPNVRAVRAALGSPAPEPRAAKSNRQSESVVKFASRNYILSEMIDGPEPPAAMRDGKISPEAFEDQYLEFLEAAFEEGLDFWDPRADNFKVDASGRIRMFDFGSLREVPVLADAAAERAARFSRAADALVGFKNVAGRRPSERFARAVMGFEVAGETLDKIFDEEFSGDAGKILGEALGGREAGPNAIDRGLERRSRREREAPRELFRPFEGALRPGETAVLDGETYEILEAPASHPFVRKARAGGATVWITVVKNFEHREVLRKVQEGIEDGELPGVWPGRMASDARGHLFFVSPDLPGETLGAALRRDIDAGLAPDALVSAALLRFARLAKALEALHARGIRHGDAHMGNVYEARLRNADGGAEEPFLFMLPDFNTSNLTDVPRHFFTDVHNLALSIEQFLEDAGLHASPAFAALRAELRKTADFETSPYKTMAELSAMLLEKTGEYRARPAEAKPEGGFIGKYELLSALRYEAGALRFRARLQDGGVEADVAIPARVVDRLEVMDRLGELLGTENDAVAAVLDWFEDPAGFDGRVLVLDENPYGIRGIGARGLVAVSSKLADDPVALFHEVAESMAASGRLSLNHILASVRGRARYEAHVKASGGKNKVHYALRALQREAFGRMDLELTYRIQDRLTLLQVARAAREAGVRDAAAAYEEILRLRLWAKSRRDEEALLAEILRSMAREEAAAARESAGHDVSVAREILAEADARQAAAPVMHHLVTEEVVGKLAAIDGVAPEALSAVLTDWLLARSKGLGGMIVRLGVIQRQSREISAGVVNALFRRIERAGPTAVLRGLRTPLRDVLRNTKVDAETIDRILPTVMDGFHRAFAAVPEIERGRTAAVPDALDYFTEVPGTTRLRFKSDFLALIRSVRRLDHYRMMQRLEEEAFFRRKLYVDVLSGLLANDADGLLAERLLAGLESGEGSEESRYEILSLLNQRRRTTEGGFSASRLAAAAVELYRRTQDPATKLKVLGQFVDDEARFPRWDGLATGALSLAAREQVAALAAEIIDGTAGRGEPLARAAEEAEAAYGDLSARGDAPEKALDEARRRLGRAVGEQERFMTAIERAMQVLSSSMDATWRKGGEEGVFSDRLLDYVLAAAQNGERDRNIAAAAASALRPLIEARHPVALERVLGLLEPGMAADRRKEIAGLLALRRPEPGPLLAVLKDPGLSQRARYLIVLSQSTNRTFLRAVIDDKDLDPRTRLHAGAQYSAHGLTMSPGRYDAPSWIGMVGALIFPADRFVKEVTQDPDAVRNMFEQPFFQDDELIVYSFATLVASQKTLGTASEQGFIETAKQIAQARAKEYFTAANSEFLVGGRLFRRARNPGALLVLVLAHEIMHNILPHEYGYEFRDFGTGIVHELGCDLHALALARAYGLDEREFVGMVDYEDEYLAVQGDDYFSVEVHEGARAQLHMLRDFLRHMEAEDYEKALLDALIETVQSPREGRREPAAVVEDIWRRYNGAAEAGPERRAAALTRLFGDEDAKYDQEVRTGILYPGLVAEIYNQTRRRPASIFYGEHLESQASLAGRALAALGHPTRGAPFWEWVFQAPLLLVVFSGAGWPALLAASLFSSAVFAAAHRRGFLSRDFFALAAVGFGLSALTVLPALLAPGAGVYAALTGLVLNAAAHAGYNAAVLAGRLGRAPVAAVIDMKKRLDIAADIAQDRVERGKKERLFTARGGPALKNDGLSSDATGEESARVQAALDVIRSRGPPGLADFIVENINIVSIVPPDAAPYLSLYPQVHFKLVLLERNRRELYIPRAVYEKIRGTPDLLAGYIAHRAQEVQLWDAAYKNAQKAGYLKSMSEFHAENPNLLDGYHEVGRALEKALAGSSTGVGGRLSALEEIRSKLIEEYLERFGLPDAPPKFEAFLTRLFEKKKDLFVEQLARVMGVNKDELHIYKMSRISFAGEGALKFAFRIGFETNMGYQLLGVRLIKNEMVHGPARDGDSVSLHERLAAREAREFETLKSALSRFDPNLTLQSREYVDFDWARDYAGELRELGTDPEVGVIGALFGEFVQGATIDRVPEDQRVRVVRKNVEHLLWTWMATADVDVDALKAGALKDATGMTIADMKPQNFVFNPFFDRVFFIDLDHAANVKFNAFMRDLVAYVFKVNSYRFSLGHDVRDRVAIEQILLPAFRTVAGDEGARLLFEYYLRQFGRGKWDKSPEAIPVATALASLGGPGSYFGEEVLERAVFHPLMSHLFEKARNRVWNAFLASLRELAKTSERAGLEEFKNGLEKLVRDLGPRRGGSYAGFRVLMSPYIGTAEMSAKVFEAAGFSLAAPDANRRLNREVTEVLEDIENEFQIGLKERDVRVIRGPPSEVPGFDESKMLLFAPAATGRLKIFIHERVLADFEQEAHTLAPFANQPPAEILRAIITRVMLHEILESWGVSHAKAVAAGFGAPRDYANEGRPLYGREELFDAFRRLAGSSVAPASAAPQAPSLVGPFRAASGAVADSSAIPEHERTLGWDTEVERAARALTAGLLSDPGVFDVVNHVTNRVNGDRLSAQDFTGEVKVAYHDEGNSKWIFRVEFGLTNGREPAVAVLKKDRSPGEIASDEIADIKELSGSGFTPSFGKDFLFEDRGYHTYYIEEFIPGVADGRTAREVQQRQRMTLERRKLIVSALLGVAILLNGEMPKDIHAKNVIISKDAAGERAVVIDIGRHRKHVGSMLLKLISFYGYFGENPGSNRFIFEAFVDELGVSGPDNGLDALAQNLAAMRRGVSLEDKGGRRAGEPTAKKAVRRLANDEPAVTRADVDAIIAELDQFLAERRSRLSDEAVSTADLLAPVKALSGWRSAAWPLRALYYAFVGTWETAAFQVAGLTALPAALAALGAAPWVGLAAGLVWSGPVFLLVHPLVRLAAGGRPGTLDWRALAAGALLFNAVYLVAGLLLPGAELLAGGLTALAHAAWDFRRAALDRVAAGPLASVGGRIDVRVLDRILETAAERVGGVETSVAGGARYFGAGDRKDLDISVVAPMETAERFLEALKEEFARHGAVMEYSTYLQDWVRRDLSRYRSVTLTLENGRKIELDIFSGESWRSHARHVAYVTLTRLAGRNDPETEAKGLVAAAYFLKSPAQYRAVLRDYLSLPADRFLAGAEGLRREAVRRFGRPDNWTLSRIEGRLRSPVAPGLAEAAVPVSASPRFEPASSPARDAATAVKVRLLGRLLMGGAARSRSVATLDVDLDALRDRALEDRRRAEKARERLESLFAAAESRGELIEDGDLAPLFGGDVAALRAAGLLARFGDVAVAAAGERRPDVISSAEKFHAAMALAHALGASLVERLGLAEDFSLYADSGAAERQAADFALAAVVMELMLSRAGYGAADRTAQFGALAARGFAAYNDFMRKASGTRLAGEGFRLSERQAREQGTVGHVIQISEDIARGRAGAGAEETALTEIRGVARQLVEDRASLGGASRVVFVVKGAAAPGEVLEGMIRAAGLTAEEADALRAAAGLRADPAVTVVSADADSGLLNGQGQIRALALKTLLRERRGMNLDRMTVMTLDENDWDLTGAKEIVTLLVMLAGNVVTDATRRIDAEIEQINFVKIQA